MNKLKIYSIIVTIILILILGFVGFSLTAKTYYDKGVKVGQADIINQITQTGNIPYFVTQGNQTIIKTENIKDICGGSG